MKKLIVKVALMLAAYYPCAAQEITGVNGETIGKVLSQIEKTYKVKFLYSESINDLKVYTSGNATSGLENNLNRILRPEGLVYHKIADNTYEIMAFDHYIKRSITEGQNRLDTLLTLYSNAEAFNRRKGELRKQILKTMGINLSVKRPSLKAIFRPEQPMNGYTVQNVAFESFPGYYVTGTLYKPAKGEGPFPVILCPHGHFYNEKDMSDAQDSGRYNPDMQYRCGALAKMGAIVLNYDMYSWGESVLESGSQTYHYTGFAMAIQTWNSIRCLDFLFSLPGIDKKRVGVTGASGGATQTIIVSALDTRITASAPVVMVSSSFDGGCQCESGLPMRNFGKFGTDNVEIAAMIAPKPQLLISEDCDWTYSFPEVDFPYLEKIYGFYGKKTNVENVHILNAHHDYSYVKRVPMYQFFTKNFGLNLKAITGKDGKIDEDEITIQQPKDMLVFKNGLPSDALRSHEDIIEGFTKFFRIPGNFFNNQWIFHAYQVYQF